MAAGSSLGSMHSAPQYFDKTKGGIMDALGKNIPESSWYGETDKL